MATQSSREAALARRLALSNSGKSAEKRFSSSPDRVRSGSETRASRTQAAAAVAPQPAAQASPPPNAAPRARAWSDAPRTIKRSPLSNPSRDLALARREALSKKGKRADRSLDRTRSEQARAAKPPAAAPVQQKASAPQDSLFQDRSATVPSRTTSPSRSSGKRALSQHNPSRALVLARRDALSKHGKSANTGTVSGGAAMRQANPEMNSRELSHRIRDLRSKTGASAIARNTGGSCRPCGPRRGKNPEATAAPAQDAPWKVGASETGRGQVVTGTQANRSEKTTGNEASTCRTITGTEYLGAEIFRSFCQSDPAPNQPAKVRISATSHGNRVTGNEVGRSEKVTGDEPGTCKTVTGTEYLSPNQAATWCGSKTASNPSPGRWEWPRPWEGARSPAYSSADPSGSPVMSTEPGFNPQAPSTSATTRSPRRARPLPRLARP